MKTKTLYGSTDQILASTEHSLQKWMLRNIYGNKKFKLQGLSFGFFGLQQKS